MNDIIVVFDSEGREISQTNVLRDQGNEITEKIINENNPDELDKLTQLFALNQKKKQIARTNKLSNLIDKVDDEVISRFDNYPNAIEDSDLLKYWSATNDALNRRNEEELSLPRIQINNQTNINLNSSGLNRESRAKVLDVVNQLLKESEVVDVEVSEVK